MRLADDERREERKIVTVLFADLVGFTEQAEHLDPEDVRALLAPYWQRLRAEIERFGGTVEKFIGDAVMALFGAPLSREDDPERAVRAALAVRDWARAEQGPQVRIAVMTGEALVQLDADPGEGEGMVAGDVVNTASRLQAAAPANGILVGESTYRATRDSIAYAEHEAVTAKGKTDPIPVWEVVETRSRYGTDLELRAIVPLVGRTSELELLIGAFERARSNHEPQLVTVVGTPGIGKSRLVAELFARLDPAADLIWWRQGRALPYGDGVSFWALGEMVKAQAGVQENDELDVLRQKISSSVEQVATGAESAWITAKLLKLVGAEPAADPDRREETFSAWRGYFEALAEQRPVVLVFEDLHWADDGLLDFIDGLAEWTSGVPLFVIGTARPELLDRRPEWGGGKLNATTLALTPLDDAGAAQIIRGVLRQTELPADVERELLERAGGNPLYAEQFAQLYADRGSTVSMPETIQGIISARLDGLPPEEKRLIQDASVFGKVFWAGAAAELAQAPVKQLEQSLHSLERKRLLRREHRSSVAGEDEYVFRHLLVRDVAYGQIPRAPRAAKHVSAAAWFERLGRADDHAELIAHHYGAALELRKAAGALEPELVERARFAFRDAGDRALRLCAFPIAERLYAAALEYWPDDAERPELLFAYARATFHSCGDAEPLAVACEALQSAGAVESAAEAGVLAAHAAWRAGRRTEAETLLDAAHRLVVDRPPSRALAEALAESARQASFEEWTVDAEAASEQALELAQSLGLEELAANVRNTLGVAAYLRGDLRESIAQHLAVVDGPTRAGEYVRALTNLGVDYVADGYPRVAQDYFAQAAEAATRMGDKPMLLWLKLPVIDSIAAQGRWDEAVAEVDAFIETVAPLGGHYHEPYLRLLRARINAARGERDAARQDLDAALERPLETDIQSTLPTLLGAAHVYQLLGATEDARAYIEPLTAALRATPQCSPAVSAIGAVTLVRLGIADAFLDACARFAETGRVWAGQLVYSGRTVDAADLLAHIAEREEEAVVRLLAAEQLVDAGRRAEADLQLRLALAFYHDVGATAVIGQAEALFAAAG
jgi:class 3 adenylate cyclase